MKDTRRKVSRNWDVCPICGRALVFTMDYSQSACVDPECRYNNEREFNFTLNKVNSIGRRRHRAAETLPKINIVLKPPQARRTILTT